MDIQGLVGCQKKFKMSIWKVLGIPRIQNVLFEGLRISAFRVNSKNSNVY